MTEFSKGKSRLQVGFPRMGAYTDVIEGISDYLGWDVIIPPTVTDKTVEVGSKYMNELMCLPAKVLLGSYIELAKQGVKDLVSFDSCGQCRLKTYYILQERALHKLGYQVKVHPVRLGWKTARDLRHIDSSMSWWRSWRAFFKLIFAIKKHDETNRETLPDNRKVKIGLVGEIYCYSDDTEVLTEDGWKLFKDVEKGEKVVQVDPTTLDMDLIESGQIYSLDYNGKMIKLKSKQIDLFVTPNHRMLYETRDAPKFRLYAKRVVVRADELPIYARIFKAGNWEGEEIKPKQFGPINMTPEQFCKFMGIWLSEGSILSPDYIERDSYGRAKGGYRKRYGIYITQKDEEVKRRIEELFQEIGITIDYNHYSKASCGSYRFQNRALWEYLRQFGKSNDKFIPREIANGKRKYLALFLEWFWYGDGGIVTKLNKTIRYKGQQGSKFTHTQWFYSSSKQLIDGVQEILLKLGKQGNVLRNSVSHMYSIQVRKTNYAQIKKDHKQEVDYNGKVYCISVDKKFIVVRRNGIVAISGNTILEPAVNRSIIKKLTKMDVFVHNSLPLSYFVFKHLYNWGIMKRFFIDRKTYKKAERIAEEYFPKNIGGHGNEAIIHTIYYALMGFEGVLHVLPFPCMPESTVATILDDISHDYHIPLLRLIFDVHSGDAGLETRLEAFTDILKTRKRLALIKEEK